MPNETKRKGTGRNRASDNRPDAKLVIRESLTIGAVARRLGISASLLRAWEKLGLACPVRTESQYRIYTAEDVRVLKRAVYLRRVVGLNAPAILDRLKQEGLLNEKKTKTIPERPSIGPRLRRLRLERGESLATVAEAVNASIGFLSSLERGQASASVGFIRKLAQYYGLNILDFFEPNDATIPLVRPADRHILEDGGGVRMELLASGKITMEPHLFRVAPGAGSGQSYTHYGEEFLYVVRGQLVMWLEDEEYRLRAGDSFYFESETPHRWLNPGKKEATILWINTPPTF